MTPYDPKRQLRELYAPKNTTWRLVDVPEQRFIGVDGSGDPNRTPAYAEAVRALYSVAYTLRFAVKRAGGREFVVGPLEGLWWADDYAAFTDRDKDAWHWTMLIGQPEWITSEMIDDARSAALEKKRFPVIAKVREVTLCEGRCAQVLHIGSYDDETPVLHRLHTEYLPERGLAPSGEHHEIYLGDPRRTEPARLKTVLRQPVRSRDAQPSA